MTTDPQESLSIQAGRASNALFNVLDACVGHVYPLEGGEWADTAVLASARQG